MGTTAEKLQYLNETKGMIKTAIKDKGVEIADTDTFRSYVDKIGEIPTTVVEEVIKAEKYGMTMDNFFGDVDENGALQNPQPLSFNGVGIKIVGANVLKKAFEYNTLIKSFTMPDITEVSSDSGFSQVCYEASNLISASFPMLETVSGSSCFYGAFYKSGIVNVSFPKLKSVTGSSCFNNIFYRCPNIKNVIFESLESVSDSYVFNGACAYCTSLESASFPKLKTINGYFREAFKDCTNLKSVDFSAVEEITTSSVFEQAFSNCTSLTSFSLPNFNYTNYGSPFGYSSSSFAFSGCTALTEIHFRADMQSTIERWQGYADKWGAVNATIYFDL